MVARISSADGEMIAIHRTFLQRDGSGKAKVERPKLILGEARGGAVYLGELQETVNVTEGIETGLSFQQMKGGPTLAACSTGGMVALGLPPLPLAAYVTIGADNDPNNAGLNAAKTAAARWRAEGRDVQITTPRDVNDFNDLLRSSPGERLGC